MKKLIMAILLATTSLTVSAKETTPVESKPMNEEIIVENILPLIKPSKVVWLHCRKKRTSTGGLKTIWCRNEWRNAKGELKWRDLDEKYWPQAQINDPNTGRPIGEELLPLPEATPIDWDNIGNLEDILNTNGL